MNAFRLLARTLPLLSAACSLLPARASSLPTLPHDYYFGHLGMNDGLAENNITTLCEDRDGYLWIGSSFGLNRYDGYEMRLLTDRAKTRFYIKTLQQDAGGRLWVETFERYLLPTGDGYLTDAADTLLSLGLPAAPSCRLYVDSQGDLWDITADSLYRHSYRDGSNTAQALPDDLKDEHSALSVSDADSLLFLLGQDHLWRFDPARRQWEREDLPHEAASLLQGNPAHDIYYLKCQNDSSGRLWVYSLFDELLLFRTSPQDPWQRLRLPQDEVRSQNSIRGVQQDHDGNVWIATDHKGLFRYRPSDGSLTNIARQADNPSSPASNNIACLLCDSHGTLWLGHFKNGISYCRPQQQVFHHRATRLGDITALLSLPGGDCWIGTDGSGLWYEDARGQLTPSALPNLTITSLQQDSVGGLWVGTYDDGLYFLRGTTLRHYTAQSGHLPHNNVTRMAFDARGGALWVCSVFNTLYRFDPATETYQVRLTGEGDNLYGLSVCIDTCRQTLYMGAVYGLWAEDLQSHTGTLLTATDREEPFTEQQFGCLYADAAHRRLWMGHRQGLTCWDMAEGRMTDFALPESGKGQVSAIVQDCDGNIWYNTPGAVSVITDGHNRTFPADGLQLKVSFNSSAACLAADGDLLFGCTEGYCRVNPRQLLSQSAHNSLPAFASCAIGDSLVDLRALQHLEYNQFPLNFTFYTGNPLDASGTRFFYRIPQLTSQWQPATGNRLTVISLPPGRDYSLQLRAAWPDGQLSEPRTIALSVSMPFWQTGGMIFLYFVVAALVLFAAVRLILVRQRRLNLQQNRIQLHEQQSRLTREKLQQITELLKNMQNQERTRPQEFIRQTPPQQSPDIEPEPVRITPLDEQFVQKSINIVEQHIQDGDFGVEALSAEIGMSRSQYYKRLMATTGKSPVEFIRTLRLKRAKQLLAQSQLQISEVAYLSGYNTLKSFGENFKAEFGITPTEYKKSLEGKS